jgi:hypothetical protein
MKLAHLKPLPIAFTNLSRRPSTYLVNYLRWAAGGSQAVTHGMSEAKDSEVNKK